MKKNHQYILRICVFCVVFVGLTLAARALTLSFAHWRKVASFLIAEAKREQIKKAFYKFPDNKESVISFGNSTILAGIKPLIFDAANNHTTYSLNCAMPALPIGISYYMLKDMYFNGQAPDYILINPVRGAPSRLKRGRLFPMYVVEGARFLEILDIYLKTTDFRVLLSYFYPIINYKDIIRYSLFKAYFKYNLPFAEKIKTRLIRQYKNDFLFDYHYGNTQSINKELLGKMIGERGYYFIREQAGPRVKTDAHIAGRRKPVAQKDDILISQKNILDYYHPSVTGEKTFESDPYIASFFDFAENKDIIILLINRPQPLDSSNKMPSGIETMPELWGEIILRYPNVFMYKTSGKPAYYPRQYFAGGGHLRPEGAEAFTKFIAKQFIFFRQELNNIGKKC